MSNTKVYPVRCISEETKKLIYDDYVNGMTPKNIGLKYHISRDVVIRSLRELNPNIEINQRFYSIFTNYFNKIDCERKAYFLGLLYADGCNTKKHSVILGLCEPDQYLLDELKADLNFGGPIHVKKFNEINRKTAYRLELCNKTISEDLTRLGCVPRKSLILKFPTEEQVPKDLLPHFIRGFFDGDGSIANNRRLEVSMISSPDFCAGLKDYLEKTLKINVYLKIHHKGNNHIVATNLRASVLVLDHIYRDATIYMKRKHERFKRFIVTYRHSKHNGGSYISNELFNSKISTWQSIFINQ